MPQRVERPLHSHLHEFLRLYDLPQSRAVAATIADRYAPPCMAFPMNSNTAGSAMPRLAFCAPS